MSTPSLRVAVFGAGHLGLRHAQRLAGAFGVSLTAIYDTRVERARAAAEPLGCPAVSDPEAALAVAEAVVVATSTASHREVVERALDAGKHVLVEKPMTGRVNDARVLVQKAKDAGLVLQVGQVERFNPALRSLLGQVPPPLFVESHRLAPLVPRNLDLDVIQDLMIHDLDLALAFMGRSPDSVEAAGVSVLTDRPDIANARLRFPGGAVANLTASRVSMDRVRKFRMFLPGTYVSADCAERRARVVRLRDGGREQLESLLREGEAVRMASMFEERELGPEGQDALEAEHEAFRLAVQGKAHSGVSGEDALATLEVMVAVERAVEEAPGRR